jgi:putative ABC transport system ATP-binding protein
MGPSGSGQVDPHAHLAASTSRPGEVSIAGHTITNLDDTALTKLRREHIGFVFQFFNLRPC